MAQLSHSLKLPRLYYVAIYHFPETLRYALYGFLLGIIFPLGSILLCLKWYDQSLSIKAIGFLHSREPLLWIIDFIPIVTSLLASFIGIKKDELNTLVNKLDDKLEDKQQSLKSHHDDLIEEMEQRRQLEDKVRQLSADALHEKKAKTKLLSTMSHEIRTPLNAIIAMAGLLQKTSMDEEQSEYTSMIRKGGDNLMNIVNNVLEWTNFDEGEVKIRENVFQTISPIEEIVELYAPQAAAKGVEMNYVIDTKLPVLIGSDQDRIGQVLTQLICNSIKFTHHGEILVEFSILEQDNFSLTLAISVKDTGIGIAKSEIPKLFQSYTQLDSSSTRLYEGCGIGLALSKKIAELLKGDIIVESELGKGSTFQFIFKVKKIVPTFPIFDESNFFENSNILIIDDNIHHSKNILGYGLFWGMNTISCTTHTEAKQILESDQLVDIIIIDMYMPEGEGLSFAKEIKNISSHEHTPIILTDVNGIKNLNLYERLIHSFLPKPIRKSDLFETFNTILKKEPSPYESKKYASLLSSQKGIIINPSLRILVAEDNKVNQKVVKKILNKIGLKPDIVSNGEEAFEAVKFLSYDIILMDIHMPKMDGIIATRAIRELGDSLPVQPTIIALTADVMAKNEKECLEAGMDDFLSKPIKSEKLAAILNKWT